MINNHILKQEIQNAIKNTKYGISTINNGNTDIERYLCRTRRTRQHITAWL